jgi:hypothetical protein
MTKKALRNRIRDLLSKSLGQVIVEVRNLQKDVVEVDIAAEAWPVEGIHDRLDMLTELFKEESWYKSRAAVICPVTKEEYLNMKNREMESRR